MVSQTYVDSPQSRTCCQLAPAVGARAKNLYSADEQPVATAVQVTTVPTACGDAAFGDSVTAAHGFGVGVGVAVGVGVGVGVGAGTVSVKLRWVQLSYTALDPF